uniref:Uncharacterized protein n=1 Tax=Aegilops tauschii subsp. strangulata TaxID=200361 RepID=A0A453SP56_AEGTS
MVYFTNFIIIMKVWIQSSKPYPISLPLKKLQGMLKDDLPMDKDCFNLVVRKFMFDDIQTAQKTKHLIAKHYLDMKFWVCSYIYYILSFLYSNFKILF